MLCIVFIFYQNGFAKPKMIHVFVALCDNVNQGIVPVPASLGNGNDPARNLYWGAAYGVKHYFDKKSDEWELISHQKAVGDVVMERVLFKHVSKHVYLLAEAYRGKHIDRCITDFLDASNRNFSSTIAYQDTTLNFGGAADLITYTGHNGLMEFNIARDYKLPESTVPDAVVLACYSKSYFSPYFKYTGAKPLIWSTHLMAPEAYVLHAIVKSWLENESDEQIRNAAAQAYHHYQKCGLQAAKKLLVSGY